MDEVVRNISRDGEFYLVEDMFGEAHVGTRVFYKSVLLQSTIGFSKSPQLILAELKQIKSKILKYFKHIDALAIKESTLLQHINTLNKLFGKSILSNDFIQFEYRNNPTNITERSFGLILLGNSNPQNNPLSTFHFNIYSEICLTVEQIYAVIYYFSRIKILKSNVKVDYVSETARFIGFNKTTFTLDEYHLIDKIYNETQLF